MRKLVTGQVGLGLDNVVEITSRTGSAATTFYNFISAILQRSNLCRCHVQVAGRIS